MTKDNGALFSIFFAQKMLDLRWELQFILVFIQNKYHLLPLERGDEDATNCIVKVFNQPF
jgi:hypothetical protein